MLYRKIDENGLFVEDVILDEQPMIEQNEESIPDPHYIAEPVPEGFYHPKWNGTEWVEGLTDEEIAEITKPQPQQPTEIEILEAKINATNEYTDFLEEVIVEMSQVVYG